VAVVGDVLLLPPLRRITRDSEAAAAVAADGAAAIKEVSLMKRHGWAVLRKRLVKKKTWPLGRAWLRGVLYI